MTNHEEEIKRMQGVIADTEKELEDFDKMMEEVAPIKVWIRPDYLSLETSLFYNPVSTQNFCEILKKHNLSGIEDGERMRVHGKKKHLYNLLFELCKEHDVELI